MRELNEIFDDVHDANIARHYLTVMSTDAHAEFYRDMLSGDFHRVGKEGTIVLKGPESAILRRLERRQIIEPANKPVRFNEKLVGYRMSIVQ